MSQSLVAVLRALPLDLARCEAYELSTHGPIVGFLRRQAGSVTTSELLDGVARGTFRGGIRCEDVQHLTFPDSSFDLCTSTEVFEHVADDAAGFAELRRVLRPGGYLVFTVPLGGHAATLERTALVDGVRIQTEPAEYHADRDGRRVFCFRNYGTDILDRLRTVGFDDAMLAEPPQRLFGHARRVVVARRAPASRVTAEVNRDAGQQQHR